MKAIARTHRLRTATITAAACTALLAGGAAPAIAVTPAATGTVVTAVGQTVNAKTAKESITVKASAKSVKHGETVTLSGKVMNIKDGSKLTVQHKKGNKWTTLHASTTVKHGAYSTKVKLNNKGTEHLRVAHGKTVSKDVTVKVT
ncbi:hypothetical protein ACFP1Z_25755 [Streptomyces gamaensis]|uniref:Bacterial Ig domain-containing protein n=1 Tax=Streptomyces gamaensis TaxID=1763542 RepID=A0ABW0Z8C9_9ACTN